MLISLVVKYFKAVGTLHRELQLGSRIPDPHPGFEQIILVLKRTRESRRHPESTRSCPSSLRSAHAQLASQQEQSCTPDRFSIWTDAHREFTSGQAHPRRGAAYVRGRGRRVSRRCPRA
eukprot:scaffold31084_cov53-Phaeocystis_antarctica.AAC.3